MTIFQDTAEVIAGTGSVSASLLAALVSSASFNGSGNFVSDIHNISLYSTFSGAGAISIPLGVVFHSNPVSLNAAGTFTVMNKESDLSRLNYYYYYGAR